MNNELQRKLAKFYRISVAVVLIGIVFSIVLHWDYITDADNYLSGAEVDLSPSFPGLPVTLLILLIPIITIIGYLTLSRRKDKTTFIYAVIVAIYLIINGLFALI